MKQNFCRERMEPLFIAWGRTSGGEDTFHKREVGIFFILHLCPVEGCSRSTLSVW
ncbi:hypothetical protein JCM6294_3559 [Bacteroides pyogenes DSM 20611 = JCM 6294]|uniref:Uncharacterized protein n=1 Tax=Bacteroides pyogenes DSM 20611 = JCM 6294 TaxID=1121100 RepID=W4PKM3_9BACE|nr:hypothetical protein JCM6294_3559 [Bacteroides pyogenes DSM 20611 = JCM 6294]